MAWQQVPKSPTSASIDDLDLYMEGLYEHETQLKAAAVERISQLFRSFHNLDALCEHPSLLPGLARVLREDGRRSADISGGILRAFFALSCFSQLYAQLAALRVGSLALDVLEVALRRSSQREGADSRPSTASSGTRPPTRSGRDRRVSMPTLASSPFFTAIRTAGTAGPLTHREAGQQQQLAKPGEVPGGLVHLAVSLLLNLAEVADTALKMLRRGILGCLEQLLLQQQDARPALRQLLLAFLLRLSPLPEALPNILPLVPHILQLLHGASSDTAHIALRLLHNVALHAKGRATITAADGIAQVARMVPHHHGGWALLYLLSKEDAHRPLFMRSLPLVFRGLLSVADLRAAPELLALAVNLTADKRIAQELGGSMDRVQQLMQRALPARDALALKVVRNVARYGGPEVCQLYTPFLEDMAATLQDGATAPDALVEVAGTMASLSLPGFDWSSLLTGHRLPEWLGRMLVAGSADDDIILECVMLAGTVCDEGSAPLLAQAGLGQTLITLLEDRREDDEFVLQIVVTLQALLQHEASRAAVLSTTKALFYLIDLQWDPCLPVMHAAGVALGLIIEAGGSWGKQALDLQAEAHGARNAHLA